MVANAVPGFLPSRHGFRFPNRWPKGAARTIKVGRWSIPIGDTARGLCGGMIFAARDRFERGEDGSQATEPPARGSPLFDEIVDRQLASFFFLIVPFRFWLAAAGSAGRRNRATADVAWPAIRREIDAGRPAMIGLVRLATWNPLAPLGHQVVGFRYEETAASITIGVYDPNHPGDDAVEIRVRRGANGGVELSQSTGERLIGLLSLPYVPAPRR
jgi:hypothetical protein